MKSKTSPLVIVMLFCAALLHGQNFNDDLLFYYPILNNANDATGHCLHGVPIGCSLASDRFGHQNSAYQFDGIDDVIVYNSNEKLKIQFPISVSLWIKVDQFPTNYNFGIFTNDYIENYYTGIWIGLLTTHKIGIGYGNGGVVSPDNRHSRVTSSTLDTTSWYHIATVFESPSEMRIYINGEDVSGSYSGSIINEIGYSDQPGFIGLKDFNILPGYFKGKIDQVSYWEKVLTQNEIDSLFTDPMDFYTADEKVNMSMGASSLKKHNNYCQVLPNPSKNGFKIIMSNDFPPPYCISIMNAPGEIVYQVSHFPESICEIKFLRAPGIYFYSIYSETNLFESGKIIIEK